MRIWRYVPAAAVAAAAEQRGSSPASKAERSRRKRSSAGGLAMLLPSSPARRRHRWARPGPHPLSLPAASAGRVSQCTRERFLRPEGGRAGGKATAAKGGEWRGGRVCCAAAAEPKAQDREKRDDSATSTPPKDTKASQKGCGQRRDWDPTERELFFLFCEETWIS